MPSVVDDKCQLCLSCASVCPVDAFRKGEKMVVVDPDECIDCVYNKICNEKCPGMRLLSTGKENKLRTPFCFAQKELINRVLYHLSQFPDDESLRLFEQNMKSAIDLANSLHIQA